MPNPVNAGPNQDGAHSLAKESKVGALVQWLTTVGASGALVWLADLDTLSWSGWWATTAVAAVGGLTGLFSAWLKKNR